MALFKPWITPALVFSLLLSAAADGVAFELADAFVSAAFFGLEDEDVMTLDISAAAETMAVDVAVDVDIKVVVPIISEVVMAAAAETVIEADSSDMMSTLGF
jgi:hypothetical protein